MNATVRIPQVLNRSRAHRVLVALPVLACLISQFRNNPIRAVAENVVNSGEVSLRIVEPMVTSAFDGSNLFCSVVPPDGNGHGRPGASGRILIFGIGLAGATDIQFEGVGVKGQILEAGSPGELNPFLIVQVEIDQAAALGARHFTIATPRGIVGSGEVVLVVERPVIRGICDGEGSPDSAGQVEVTGVGLDGASAISFSGSGMTGTVTPWEGDEFGFLNPSVEVHLKIGSDAPLGPQSFSLRTDHGDFGSGNVTFNVINPRIDAMLEGHNFHHEFITDGEGAPGTAGDVIVTGVGLGGATAISFSGPGVSGTVTPPLPELVNELNPDVLVNLKIDASAPLGDQIFSLTIPRSPKQVRSWDNHVKFMITAPRVDFISDERGFSEAVAGACGTAAVGGVGVRDGTSVEFSLPGGITAEVLSRQPTGTYLNDPITLRLRIEPTAALGSRTFAVKTPQGIIPSGATVFTISRPRIFLISTDGALIPSVQLMSRVAMNRARSVPERQVLWRTLLAKGLSSAQFSIGDEAARGSSGQALILGVGLFVAQGVRFSATDVSATVMPFRPDSLNPPVPITIDVNRAAALEYRTFEVTITGVNPTCQP